MEKLLRGKKRVAALSGLAAVVIVVTAAVFLSFVPREDGRQDGRNDGIEQSEKRQSYESLGASDRETAGIYAELYETTAEEVAGIQVRTGDWEKTGKELEKSFFTIPENKKYQMTQEGYRIEDLNEAERLSARSGVKAMELAQAKGKASDNRSWEEVKKEKGIDEE